MTVWSLVAASQWSSDYTTTTGMTINLLIKQEAFRERKHLNVHDLKRSFYATCRNDIYNSWLKHIYAIHFYALWCNAHVRPGLRRQRLILVTKAIIQLVFKKEKKKTSAQTYNPGMKNPLKRASKTIK